mmetsp:Transcript_28089/g.61651  ORF Transcript_28089/g.61651 Transcript_28089/m.61651 type:complete len:219 (-) Transcript_28089:436-1092(-)
MAGTPNVSSCSSVSLMSSIDLTPADTTTTGVLASSYRSADMSSVVSAPRCTPPVPPVTKVDMPAKLASFMVDATVVAPHWCPPSLPTVLYLPFLANNSGKSLVEHLPARFSCPDTARSAISTSLRPIRHTPPLTATVAGTTPLFLKMDAKSRLRSKFCGYGIPCAIMVDSSATTGRFDLMASDTSGRICSGVELLPVPAVPVLEALIAIHAVLPVVSR